ncbi:hypothetical protein [Nocardioides acrostichi]|uniref:Lipoprotein n=1 Tax=Nocardioides acrostichi TaxID=2784339 RepID=A0A930V5U1_9ACTN|nr:hypothetical protein [Nocardioides acrostichi]MBF4163714.1 hypothetical protein [Nocardioides acrostichi]
MCRKDHEPLKFAALPLVLALAVGAAGCGGDDSADPDSSSSSSGTPSSDASAGSAPSAGADADTEFCQALASMTSVQDGADVVKLHDALESAGLPDDAGADAQAGLKVYLKVLSGVDAKASRKELQSLQTPDLSKTEQSQVAALVQYSSTACGTGATSGQ